MKKTKTAKVKNKARITEIMTDAFSFGLIGALIFVGFFASIFFQRTKISEVLILIVVGFIIGPLLKVVDPATITPFAPFFSGIALIILLFGGGLNLNFHKVLYEFAPASIFTLVAFVLSTLGIGLATYFVTGWHWLVSLMFGAVVSGTSSEVVMNLVTKTRAREEVKTMLQLESALTDALTIVTAIAIAQVISTNSFDLASSVNAIAGGFSIAAVVGLIAGAVWMNFLKGFKGKFDYMLTLAAAFILYAGVEFTKGNGGIAVLVFGIVLGNAKQLAQMVTAKIDEKVQLPLEFKDFQNEISFFVKTFFFISMGLLLTLQSLTLQAIVIGAVLTLVALVTRRIAVQVLGYGKKPETTLITTMMPKGLAAAVMSSIPATYGIQAPGFTELALLIIIGSNVVTTLGVFKSEREYTNKPVVLKIQKKS